MAWDGSAGVEKTFSMRSCPCSSQIQSVKVPPVSMATGRKRDCGRRRIWFCRKISTTGRRCMVPYTGGTRARAPAPHDAHSVFWGQGKRYQGLLLYLVCLGRSGGGARARGTLYRQYGSFARYPTEARQHIEKGSHVRGLFLHPDNLPGRGILGEYPF